MSRRGRSYVRHHVVLPLHVDVGSGDAMVQGSETHSREVRIAIQPLTKWILWQNSFKGGSPSP